MEGEGRWKGVEEKIERRRQKERKGGRGVAGTRRQTGGGK